VASLIDTSLLARLANSSDAQHDVAVDAVLKLHRLGEVLHITPQVLIEFRNVATRSTNLNGLGLSIADAETQAAGFESLFSLLADSPDIYSTWKGIVEALGVIGKQVHDARLVAVCHVYGVTHLLTFNTTHFARLAAIGPGIVVVDPRNV
jgi:predicted nucleic acid-binding protein